MSEKKPIEPGDALDHLANAGWITPEQHAAGIAFRKLWRSTDGEAAAVRSEICADLMKCNTLDLTCRVCRDDRLRIAFDRLDALRQGLNAIALRMTQIERHLSTEPRRERRVLLGLQSGR